MLLHVCCGIVVLMFRSIFNLSRGTNHSLVREYFIPLSTALSLYSIVHSLSKKDTVHPASHNLTTGSNDWCRSCGIMCASIEHLGSVGQSMLHSCIDVIVFPSGIIMFNGFFVVRMFLPLHLLQ